LIVSQTLTAGQSLHLYLAGGIPRRQ
jgi:hypothetical protein